MAEWPQIRGHLAATPIEIDPVSVARTWDASLELARAHQLSVYDEMYLELATRLRMPLATPDREIRNAAPAAGTEVPEITQ